MKAFSRVNVLGLVALTGSSLYFSQISGRVPKFTKDQLKQACEEGENIWIGCKGKIYDVKDNKMYSKDGSYNLFVGKDSSVALGKMEFDDSHFQKNWKTDLSEKELKILQEWEARFEKKYPVVGLLK